MHVSLGVKGEHATAAIAGLGMTNLVNHAPVRPGDVLSHVNEVIDRRPSKSRPGTGIVTFRNTLSNQHGAAVFSYENAPSSASATPRTGPLGRHRRRRGCR